MPKQPTALARPNTHHLRLPNPQGRGIPHPLRVPPVEGPSITTHFGPHSPTVRPEPVELTIAGALPPKHTLTRAPGAQANAPVTLPPCNTHAMTSTRTSPQLLRRGAPRLHRACRQSPPLPRLKTGGCFARAQKWQTDRCSWNEYPSYENTPRSDTGSRNNLLALPAPAPATPTSNRDLRRQEIGEVAKGEVPERC